MNDDTAGAPALLGGIGFALMFGWGLSELFGGGWHSAIKALSAIKLRPSDETALYCVAAVVVVCLLLYAAGSWILRAKRGGK